MSTEHQTVMAQMALLQGTIDQRKKTLGSSTAAFNANSQPYSSSVTPLASSSNQQQSSQTFVNPSLSPNLPIVTKTTWQSTASPNRQPMINPLNFRPQTRGLTKLILNQPDRLFQTKLASTSTSIPSIHLTPPSSSAPNQPNASAALPATHSLPSLLVSSESTSNVTPSPIPSPSPTPSPLPTPASPLGNKAVNPDPKSSLLPVRPTTAHNPNELVINGVSFVRDTQGKRLFRKTEPSTSSQSTKAPAASPNGQDPSKNGETKPTPIKAMIGGMTYIRTKSGNLVELTALRKFQSQKIQELKKAKLLSAVNAMKTKYQSSHSFPHWDSNKVYSKPITVSRPPLIKKNKQCQFFAKTGACRNGLTCVYQHDPLQVSICPRFLRRRCPHSAGSCPLSHVPSAHNMEHCSHFPRCTKSDCPYPHVQATTSQICQEFADSGWCSKGAQCTERHVKECPEFSTKGTCSNVGCRLRHMINRNSNDHEDSQAAEPGPSDEDGAGLFFTDLTGTESTAKRKANPPTSNPRISQESHHGPSKGISHNFDRPFKRIKYDAMADNDDYVMFISSDEEEASAESEDNEADDEPPSSIDSEELERASLERLPEKSQPDPSPETRFDGSPNVHYQILDDRPIQTRIRTRLCSEEIEEGEIIDDDDYGDDQVITTGKESVTDYFADGNSSDEDEMIARQLVGDRLRTLAL